jgi:hypothetical protein
MEGMLTLFRGLKRDAARKKPQLSTLKSLEQKNPRWALEKNLVI